MDQQSGRFEYKGIVIDNAVVLKHTETPVFSDDGKQVGIDVFVSIASKLP